MCGSGTTSVSPKRCVEAAGEVAGELEVLALVLPHRHDVGVVDEDVGGLQHGIGEEPDVGPGALGGLVLELRHPAGLAEAGEAREHPRQLGVLGDVALDEEHRPCRVDTAGDELGGRQTGALPQHGRVGRDGQRVQVGDEVEGVVRLLQPDPLHEGTDVVAEVQRVARRLHAGEAARLVRRRCGRRHGCILAHGAAGPAPRPIGFTAERSRMPSDGAPWESDPAAVQPSAERGCLECAVPTDALAIAPAILAVVLVVSAVGSCGRPAASAQAFTAPEGARAARRTCRRHAPCPGSRSCWASLW